MDLRGGDCLVILKTLDANTFDSLVTDPPAGISFMGKEWDGDKGGREKWVQWMTEVMREALRVLKPGAHGLVWAIPRTSHWTATALELAGFEIRDVITHLFGSGFPKSLDVSKAIDKSKGAEREVSGPQLRPDGSFRINTEKTDGTSFASGSNDKLLTEPSTDLAKQWQGWGTALKPASEHWILVRKPLSEKTVAKNVERWGTGAINIDACRVELFANDSIHLKNPHTVNKSGPQSFTKGSSGVGARYAVPKGRFPANLILSHADECEEDICSMFCPVRLMDQQSGTQKLGRSAGGGDTESKNSDGNWFGKNAKAIMGVNNYNDSGGASRFFYCAKASKKDRGEENVHPTVKASKLMEYLITLVTPPKGIVLDPFMGSGTTGVAAKRLGFNFVGIERDPIYFNLAEKRIQNMASKEMHGS